MSLTVVNISKSLSSYNYNFIEIYLELYQIFS